MYVVISPIPPFFSPSSSFDKGGGGNYYEQGYRRNNEEKNSPPSATPYPTQTANTRSSRLNHQQDFFSFLFSFSVFLGGLQKG